MEEIPEGKHDSVGPCWIRIKDSNGNYCKPVIKCKCGQLCGIGLHHVHSDGTVTASFYDSEEESFTYGGKTYTHPKGCGWHVHLKLLNYDCGDFPSVE